MKRKIAAIFAADIAGYSRLVAEDEEETLRRLASYRQVTDDFIAKGGGRIFNTAGDAVLAEFPSAVEAVRCAIDIQESLRTRNMAYPPSRQMAFRIGITIGDVVERDGDLLGDGVNIAARLEGLAEVGGICISRAVHEQVANKLSVQFADIGAQEVKNIPTPVHAYMVAMRREDGTYGRRKSRSRRRPRRRAQPNWMWPVAVTVVEPCRDRRRRLSLFRPSWRRTVPSKSQSGVAAQPQRRGCRRRRSRRRLLPPGHRNGRACAAARRRLRRRSPSSSEKFARRQSFRSSPTRSAPRLPSDYVAGRRFQGLLAQYWRLQRFRHRAAERRGREVGRGRAMSEARRYRPVAAQMRTLRGRRYRRLRRTASRRAAVALDQA